MVTEDDIMAGIMKLWPPVICQDANTRCVEDFVQRDASPEGAFLTLGAKVLAQRRGDIAASVRLAEALIAEEGGARPRFGYDDRFLVSLTSHRKPS